MFYYVLFYKEFYSSNFSLCYNWFLYSDGFFLFRSNKYIYV